MRRHSVCIHNPPCYYITDGGTDSSATECCLPRCRNHPKKKKSQNVNISRHVKRKESISVPKPCYGPRYSSLKCNKTRTQLVNYENRFLKQDLKRTKHKSVKTHEGESSYDVGSVSSRSTCMSIEVNNEMAAVNKDIEAILARYQKEFDETTVDEPVPQFKTTDRARYYRQKKDLTSEQLKLLSMEKPPLDKLKELPREYVGTLKPRLPPSYLNKEKVSTTYKAVKRNLKESFEAFLQKEQVEGNHKSELLESMWKDVVERGLLKENFQKNIKPIYTSMTLDENASININFRKPYSNQESQQMKGTSVGTVISPRMKTNPSVATQTSSEYDLMLNRIKNTNSIINGLSNKTDDTRKKNNCSPDPKNLVRILDGLDKGDSDRKDINKSIKPSPQIPKPSGDASLTGNPKEILQLLQSKIDSRIKQKSPAMFVPGQPRELNVYTVQTPEPADVFKKSDWNRNKTDILINSTDLLSRKQAELNINEKVVSMINKATPEQFSRVRDIIPQPSNREKINQETEKPEGVPKNSTNLDFLTTDKTTMSTDDKLKDCSENNNASTTLVNNIPDQEEKTMCSLLQTINPDLKYMKENCDGLDTPLCVEIIKRLTDTMMKCEPGKMSDELTTRSCYRDLDELRRLRAQHLRHIQNEVKHIEELDKFLDSIGITAQLLYTAANLNIISNRKMDQ